MTVLSATGEGFLLVCRYRDNGDREASSKRFNPFINCSQIRWE
ncbi:hypothetical protein FRUB_05063 [Fimbriiglobus ruber]|uniref:Uncharacterized protein n=1 Tax=Fimbriiglobus ruber TaxID=1908690 RepID=A0A225DKE2_9BACT|nr:hypothetical protein FRUB_05063 [Fimbriiglobus ruber]